MKPNSLSFRRRNKGQAGCCRCRIWPGQLRHQHQQVVQILLRDDSIFVDENIAQAPVQGRAEFVEELQCRDICLEEALQAERSGACWCRDTLELLDGSTPDWTLAFWAD